MENENFERWLENYYEENINNNSNNMNPAFEGARDTWFSDLDSDEIFQFADIWMQEFKKDLLKDVKNIGEILTKKNV